MRAVIMLVFTGIFSFLLHAEVPEFLPKITDVTVFKDGNALVVEKGKARVEDGWCRTTRVPYPLIGTIWASAGDGEIDFLRASKSVVVEKIPCAELIDILNANIGKKVVVKDNAQNIYKGVIKGIMRHESTKEVVKAVSEEDRYSRWGYNPGRETLQSQLEKQKTESPFLMLESEEGMNLIKHDQIKNILFEDKNPVMTKDSSKEYKEMFFHAVKDKRALNRETEVGFVYVQKGIRYIPDYKIDYLDNGNVKLALQATVINELGDIDGASLRLVVGVPSFIMKNTISPMSLSEASPYLSSFFRPPERGGQNSQYNMFSNAVMSQVAASPSGSEASAGPDIPAEGQLEDLYIYTKPGFSLKKGESALVKLLEVTAPFKDIYTWDIPPLPPQDILANLNSSQNQQMRGLLSASKAIHKLRIKNTGDIPWTTGPATIFKDNNSLGQSLLTYTSAGSEVDVAITTAVDLSTKKEEKEISRKSIVVAGNSYQQVFIHGTLSVTNLKSKPVRIYITRKAIGKVSEATDDGKIRLTSILEDTDISTNDYSWQSSLPQYYFNLNSYSEIKWDKTIPAGKTITVEYDLSFIR